jgi:hypothetical protein
MGESTGYPVIGVSVGHAADVKNFADKDLLVLGSPQSQSLFHEWAKQMPFAVSSDGTTIGLSDLAFRLVDWWRGDHGIQRAPRSATMTLSGMGPGGAIMGFESPLKSGRSVVAISGEQPQDMADVLSALMNPDLVDRIQGGLTIVHGRHVNSIASGEPYYVGSLPPLTYIRWILSEHPLLLALAAVLAALIIAALLFRVLRAIAAKRLKG